MIPWEIQAREFVNCNCGYACPCQFNDLPTHGRCEAAGAIAIDKGHFGDVSLDGTRIAFVFWWPGAVHEGKGKCLPIVDEGASEDQREALLTVMSGGETDPFATMFNVFASTVETVYDPVFTRIDFDVDIEERKGRINVEGYFETVGEPIRNPVTGDPHRVRIDLLSHQHQKVPAAPLFGIVPHPGVHLRVTRRRRSGQGGEQEERDKLRP